MKYRYIVSLWLFFVLLSVPAAGEEPAEAEKRGDDFFTLKLTLPEKPLEEAVGKQLNRFLRVAASLDSRENSPVEAARLLMEAAALASEETRRKYLTALAEDIKKNELSASTAEWLRQSGQSVDMVLHKDREKDKWTSLVYIVDPDSTGQVKTYIAEADRMMEKAEVKKYLSVDMSSIIAPILVSHLVYASRLDRFILASPEEPPAGQQPGFKLIVFKNLMEAYFTHIVKPLGHRILAEEWGAAVDFDAYFLHAVLHRLCHYIGPVILDKEMETVSTVREAIPDQFPVVEEVKARTMAVHFTGLLAEDKLVSKEQETRAFVIYFIYLLEKLRYQPEADFNVPYLVQFNYLLQKGAVSFDIGRRKFSLHLGNMKTAVSELMSSALEAQKSGSTSRAEKLLRDNSSVSALLKTAVKLLEGLPLHIKLAYPQPVE